MMEILVIATVAFFVGTIIYVGIHADQSNV